MRTCPKRTPKEETRENLSNKHVKCPFEFLSRKTRSSVKLNFREKQLSKKQKGQICENVLFPPLIM